MNIQQSFQILGLARGASPQAAKSAYRRLVKTYHPDRFAHDPDRSRAFEETIKQINDAYGQVQSYFSLKNRRQQPSAKKTEAPRHEARSSEGPSGMAKKTCAQRARPGRMQQPPLRFRDVFKEALLSQKKPPFHSPDRQSWSNMVQHPGRHYYSYAAAAGPNPVEKPVGPIQEVNPVPPVSPVRPRYSSDS